MTEKEGVKNMIVENNKLFEQLETIIHRELTDEETHLIAIDCEVSEYLNTIEIGEHKHE